MTGTLPPEAGESQIPTSQRIKMVGFATDTERTRLLRDANIKAAAEEKVDWSNFLKQSKKWINEEIKNKSHVSKPQLT